MNFSIELKRFFTLEVKANTMKEALEEAKALYPDFKADYIHNDDTNAGTSVNYCEGCGMLIMDDEVEATDLEGGEYCKGCADAIKEDMAINPEDYPANDEEDN